jgi:hypothetical protein
MTFITIAQFLQLGRKCILCNANAQWLDKFDENAPAYCDHHFPGRVCECEICKEESCDT